MQVQYSDKIRQNPELFALVEQASRPLEQVAPHSVAGATAQWDLTRDGQGQSLVTLRLSVGVDSVATQFTPEQLRWTIRSWQRFYSIWSDLLEARDRRRFKDLLEPASTEGR
jgi:hypothetical protein